MRIAICDDDTDFLGRERNAIKIVFEQNFEDEKSEIDSYTSGIELIEKYREYMYDMILLDLEIGEQNGFEVAEQLVAINSDVIIIFVTSHENLVYEAFKFRPLGFMVKNRFEKEFAREIHKIIKKLIDTKMVIEIGKKRFYVDNIVRMMSYKRKIYLRTTRGEVAIVDSYNKYVNEFEKAGFVEASKGILINMRYISSINQDNIIMYNCESVAISRRKKKNVIEKYEDYVLNKM